MILNDEKHRALLLAGLDLIPLRGINSAILLLQAVEAVRAASVALPPPIEETAT
jgi:hypothetical protein